jgi:hypothetical protein
MTSSLYFNKIDNSSANRFIQLASITVGDILTATEGGAYIRYTVQGVQWTNSNSIRSLVVTYHSGNTTNIMVSSGSNTEVCWYNSDQAAPTPTPSNTPSNTPSTSSAGNTYMPIEKPSRFGTLYATLKIPSETPVGRLRVGDGVSVFEDEECWYISDNFTDNIEYTYQGRCFSPLPSEMPNPTPSNSSANQVDDSYRYLVEGCSSGQFLRADSASPKSIGTTWKLTGFITPSQSEDTWTIVSLSNELTQNIGLGDSALCDSYVGPRKEFDPS